MAGNSEPNVPGDAPDNPEIELEDHQGTETEDEFAESDPDSGYEADEDGEDGERDRGSEDEGSQAQVERNVRRSHSARPGRRERERARLDNLERENREFREQVSRLLQQQQQPTPAQIAEQARIEREQYEALTPYEQHLYSQQKFQQQQQQILQQINDRSDQGEYARLVEQNPNYRRFADKVEELRKQAPNVPRRILLATAIGMAALDGGGEAKTRARNTARDNKAAQQARPATGRSDVAPQRTRTGARGFEHLRNVQI